jgi:NtrC-family two-component system response regulator AlgB
MFTERNLTRDPNPPSPSLPSLDEGPYIALSSLSHPKTGPGGNEFEKIIGASRGMSRVLDQVRMVAATDSTVLIQGETGTGKEVIAQAIHDTSPRRQQRFVAINCAAIPAALLESELFGHDRGAFTGAVTQRMGRFQAADRGTLFLDEIGDLPLEIQPKLLRLLQEREYERLGENVIRQANVRVIAATNRDLKKRVAEGAFREDLYFRLNVITVQMPPLRSLDSDLIRFTEHYEKFFAEQCGRKPSGLTPEVIACIRNYSWPGNLRELRNSIERAVIMAKSERISPEDFPAELRGQTSGPAGATEDLPQVGSLISLDKLEESHLRKILERTKSLTEAAEILGIDQATLYRKRKKIGLE